ncbi:MAG: type I polyketide synthase [Candidatus Accumulibacter sp.]|uniref:type I polyketide synthase n=1 Tax=Accumulibacter sp. TaxID=2053492 RepID=UPI00287B09E5|nr:type I polyketide synthase [Accumulibacter sp.]MDS4016557.1 type I polyketide synthase [Accumulibacter sp.]
MVKKANSVLDEAAVIGVSCQLPGANSVNAYWSLLREGRNCVRQRPTGRWSIERFLRAGDPEPGFAYTFAGGYLDDPFAFDPTPFGISPRESQQMDPQQRLLLEMTWHALEDAGIPPLSLSGANVGVYVGASMVDYQSGASHDPAVMESHFMTGNSLSILSNRISYSFDFHGPSFTLDSACSSSFVAINQAMEALRDGQIDLAVVGGVNLLLSPAPFIGFSQARMLSPTGLSRPFSQDADGYVRSEGAVVFVLRRLDDAVAGGDRIRSVLVGSAINSDGRTTGISLPSLDGQRRLITDLYSALDLDPDRLAFVEAHGTGTKVGDPIEASAIGLSLGQHRSRPLPIGSAKSNIGHLEAASGLAGLLKSTLALEKRVLPRSLFLESPNTSIDFEALNLVPNANARELSPTADGLLMASVCNYGFGGTNAHVVLRAPSKTEREAAGRARAVPGANVSAPSMIVLTAATEPALRTKAGALVQLLETGADVAQIAAGLGHQNEAQKFRLAVPLGTPSRITTLLADYHRDGIVGDGAEFGQASGDEVDVAFVFSGNGSQFGEMGKAAYAANADFRREIQEIDAIFQPLSGWSLADSIAQGIHSDRLQSTSVSQPLIYAIQSALAAVLGRYGIRPAVVLGHSVGEVAAAETCGALTRKEAVNLIYLRSRHQEGVRGRGRMLVVAANEETVRAELDNLDGGGALEIAATNSPTSTTVTGPADPLAKFSRHCRKRRLATVALDIDYPFHSSILDPLRDEMIADLARIVARDADIAFVSTVTGSSLPGSALQGDYWWNNVRRPVQFQRAVETAADMAMPVFVEIGPRAILTGPIAEVLRTKGGQHDVLASLNANDVSERDPVMAIVGRLIAHGTRFDRDAVCGSRGPSFVELPQYPFQHSDYNLPATHEALLSFGRMWQSEPLHPLLGAKMADGSPEWRSLIDTARVPYLSDHRVDGGVIVPAAGLIEIALAAGRDLFAGQMLELDEFDIFKALAIADGEAREISTRYFEVTETIEIWSRRRFSAQEWVLHARGVLSTFKRALAEVLPPPIASEKVSDTAAEVYAEAERAGLEYGPLFQLVTASERDPVTTDAQLAAPEGGLGAFEDLHVVHPASLDAAFHGLFISRPQLDGETKAHLPVRFRKICVWKQGATIRRAITLLTHETNRFKTVAISLLDEAGELAVSVEAAVLRALYLSKATIDDRTFRAEPLDISPVMLGKIVDDALPEAALETDSAPDSWLVTRALVVSTAYESFKALLSETRLSSLPALRESPRIAAKAQAYFDALFDVLDHFGALSGDGTARTLVAENPLPPPDTLLGTLAERCPEATLELRLAAHAVVRARSVLESGNQVSLSPHMLRRLEVDGALAAPVISAIAETLEKIAGASPRRLRVVALEPWNAALDRICRPLIDRGLIDLTLATTDPSSIEDHRVQHSGGNIEYLLLAEGTKAASAAQHDLVLHVASRPIDSTQLPALRSLTDFVSPSAEVLVAVPGSDIYLDALCGCWTGWLTPLPGTETGSLRTPTADAVKATLSAMGFSEFETTSVSSPSGVILHGRIASTTATADIEPVVAVFGNPGEGAIAKLARHLTAETFDSAKPAALADWVGGLPEDIVPTVFVPVPSWPRNGHAMEAVEEIALRIEAIKALLESFAGLDRPVRVYVATHDSMTEGGNVSESDAALYGFVRVAINEFPAVDLRLLDIDLRLVPERAAQLLGQLLRTPGLEREWLVGPDGLRVNRIRRGLEADRPLQASERSVLRFDQPGRLESFQWVREVLAEPAEGEVEISVSAVGLNFRDILVGLGILDDDLLGAGLTAASLGFECAGIVTRAGPGVTSLKPGDRVMGFARDAFTSHVTAPAWQFMTVPDGMALEAAATIPVAFATAWFSLVERARIRAGQTVLVHGGAGGVGLAAIQIAKRAGARVLATASSEERRAIARAAGADLVYDSRNERFVDAIRHDIGGVDIVLNSLAGPAMVASFKLVKPFGSFIELGKRDYLDNSQLALRPFIRNIAYFGVDLDELLSHDRRMISEMMANLTELMASGELFPLPYQAYEAHEIGDAFRSMQASEHVGKIVVRPAQQARRDFSLEKFEAGDGVYLVIGGTGGLGFATAQWLARKGAGTVVLASRRGTVERELAASVDAMKAAGTKVVVATLDVTDKASVKDLVRRMCAEHGPLRGIVHAAVQLDDGMISSLTPERLRAVLRPKVKGVLNLEAAAEGQPLDLFVVYSSATTVIGSPGQGAYVAANAFLEAFAKRRRAQGKPALAIGWGAIADVGIIARDKQLGQRLRRTTGVVGIKSSEGLAHLGRLLAMGNAAGAIQFYTNIAPGAAAEKLALLNSPAFTGLALTGRDKGGEEGEDLFSAISGKPKAEALVVVTEALRREVSHILRMPVEQIDVDRPLGELGLDSLMALELHLSIERLSGREVPMIGAGDRRLTDIANNILNQLTEHSGEADTDPSLAQLVTLVQKHTTVDLSSEDLEALRDKVGT